MHCLRVASTVFLSIVFASASNSANAELIDFTSGFVNGNLSNTISTSTADVSFDFTDANNILVHGQPRISTGSGLNDSLEFKMNSPNTSNYVSLLVSFDTLVSDVSFTLGDIDHDHGAWQDIVVITGLLNGMEVGNVITSNLGAYVGRDTDGNDYLTKNNATLYGIANNNDKSGETYGNVDVMFSSTIDSFRIDYRPGHWHDGLPDFGPHNPSKQFIRLGSLQFVPEPGSGILFGCAVLLPSMFRRRGRKRA